MINEELELRSPDRPSMPTSRDFFSVLFRQRKAMLAAFALVLIAVIVSGAWMPKYEAHMKILVRRPRADATATPWANSPPPIGGDQVGEADLNSEVELLNSEDILRKVVVAAGLVKGQPSQADAKKIEKASIQLSKDLKIEAVRKSNLISATYTSRDPQMTANVLNALAAAFMEKHLEVYRSSGELKFFDQQAEQYRQSLDQAQQQVTKFSKDSGVVSAPLERDATLQRANEFDSNARQAQAAIAETRQRIQTLQEQMHAVQPRMTTVVRTSENSALMEQMKSTLLNLQLKRTDLLAKYAPTHPLVQEVDKQISEARAAIDAEVSKPAQEETTDRDPNYEWIRSELTKAQTELSGLTARAAASSSMAERYRAEARSIDQKGFEQQDLMRNVKTQEENYFLYERKREEARISAALDARGILNVTISEPPIVPAVPVRSPYLIGLIALVVGLCICLFTAFAADALDPTFHTPDELAAFLGAPVLAALPKGGE